MRAVTYENMLRNSTEEWGFNSIFDMKCSLEIDVVNSFDQRLDFTDGISE